jgi:glycosyltransferase involved in cell wall biosynthesis
MSEQDRLISIVVPLLNEQECVGDLVVEIETAMRSAGLSFELIMVDDGSADETVSRLGELREGREYLTIVEFRRNFGQTAAMAAGFDHARGEIIIPLDGDLQNDPKDIPRLIAKLDEGYDVVSGWRKDRKDKFITRKIPSCLANWLIGVITKVPLHDYGCTLKAYRRETVSHLRLYGEMHRFLPAMASWSGARVTEMPVNHRPRTRGVTKYGLNRTFKVVLDLLTVKFLGSFSTKPIHIFGGFGILTFLASMIMGLFVLYQKFISAEHLPLNRNALFTISAILVMMSAQFMLMGLLAEMLARTYHESQSKPTYIIRRITPSREARPRTEQAGTDDA